MLFELGETLVTRRVLSAGGELVDIDLVFDLVVFPLFFSHWV